MSVPVKIPRPPQWDGRVFYFPHVDFRFLVKWVKEARKKASATGGRADV